MPPLVIFYSLDNYSYYNDENESSSDFQLFTEKHMVYPGNDFWNHSCTIVNGELTLFEVYNLTSNSVCNIYEHSRIKIAYGGDHGGGSFTISIAIIAQFPD